MNRKHHCLVCHGLVRHGLITVSMTLLALLAPSLVAAQDGEVDFGREIRPLLAEKCFACHGLDAGTRETDLRMDTKGGLFAALESGGFAVVPKHLDESVLYRRLISEDADERMPPADVEKQLSPEEIDLIKRWIEQGAVWKQHWAWVTPQQSPLPQVADAGWSRNEIDMFIQARLEKAGLTHSPAADKTTLIRRVTFDLTGLPPTPPDVDEFLADESPEAYEKVVDRLLKSPHYGEHMGRYWLDAARYGDTHGLHLDNFRQMWPYRDWVINAFNNNMPFDEFTIEQLAGDLLPNATDDQKIATGFNRCNVTTSEGGVIPEEYYVHYTVDRVATTATVWMGISMGCVVCHEHKFDPFEMKDFYQLFAFFNSLDGPVMDGNRQDTAPVLQVSTDAQKAELDDLDKLIAALSQTMTDPIADVDAAQTDWEAHLRESLAHEPAWDVLVAETLNSEGGATLTNLEDNSILAGGENPAQEVYEITARVDAEQLTAIRLEGLTHESLPERRAGRSRNGNVVLTELEVEFAPVVAPVDGPENWQRVQLTRGWADHEQPDGDFKIANAIDGDPKTGWAIDGHRERGDREAIFMAEAPFGHEGGMRLRIRLRHESVYGQHQFGHFRLSVTADAAIPQMDVGVTPDEIVKLIELEPDALSDEQRIKIRDYYREQVTDDPTLVEARSQLALHRKRRTELDESIPTTLVWKELSEPKPAFILVRGAYDKPGDPVSRNTPAALPPLSQVKDGQTPTRLDLARWLVAPEHPLTSRVTVNRFWQQYFGVGIVETTEDFGSQGSAPTHPQLLDWLAVEFRESGWDVKALQKLIVMSATYRQSSQIPADVGEQDPQNRLLSRGPRFRFDAEVIRDNALAAGGLLVEKIGGPSVKPYQPPGIWYAVGYTDSNTANFKRDSGQALYRRSLYTFWKRTAPPPTLVTLDAPSRETCTVRRSRTNTPLAALALMNDEQFIEASRGFAQRVMREGGASDDERAAFAFRLATARLPDSDELAVLLDVYRANLERYEMDQEAAGQLVSVGESQPDDTLDTSQLAAWTMVANMLLNLDETLTKG